MLSGLEQTHLLYFEHDDLNVEVGGGLRSLSQHMAQRMFAHTASTRMGRRIKTRRYKGYPDSNDRRMPVIRTYCTRQKKTQ